MAAFGAKYPIFAPFEGEETSEALPKYGQTVKLGRLVSANLTVNTASGELWADDELAEQVTEFASGSIPMETDDIEDEAAAVVYGAKVSNKEVTNAKGDTSPYGGLAYVRTLMRNGVKFFRGYFYPKVRAAIGNENAQTRGSSITFTTSTTNFTVFATKKGPWRFTETFSTEEEAKTWAEGKLKNAEAVSVATEQGSKVEVKAAAENDTQAAQKTATNKN